CARAGGGIAAAKHWYFDIW
nr:immunoglobulin heavy chain junction region [Macaca mulatta]